jgi:hypothetical protein
LINCIYYLFEKQKKEGKDGENDKINESEEKDPHSLNNYDAIFKEKDLQKVINRESWEEYKDMSCDKGISFKQCIFPGIKIKKSAHKFMYASSYNAYKIYPKVY